MYEEPKYWPQDPPYGGLPPEINFAPDPEIQCRECDYCHEVELYAKDEKTVTGSVYICTCDPTMPEHVANPDKWRNLHDYGCYEGDGPYR